MGVPGVIVSRGAGAAELVDDGVNGFLTRPGASSEISHRITRLLGSPPEAERIGANGLLTARSCHVERGAAAPGDLRADAVELHERRPIRRRRTFCVRASSVHPNAVALPEPLAVTIDLWFTLIAFSRAGPRAYERARRTAWVEPLVAGGLPVCADIFPPSGRFGRWRNGRANGKRPAAPSRSPSRRTSSNGSCGCGPTPTGSATRSPSPWRVGEPPMAARASTASPAASGRARGLQGRRQRLQHPLRTAGVGAGVAAASRSVPGFFDAIVLSADGPGRETRPWDAAPGGERTRGRAVPDPPHRGQHRRPPRRRAGGRRLRPLHARPRSPALPHPLPHPRVRTPRLRRMERPPGLDSDQIWRAASAARDRAVRRARTGPATRRRRPRGRATAPRNRRPIGPRSPRSGTREGGRLVGDALAGFGSPLTSRARTTTMAPTGPLSTSRTRSTPSRAVRSSTRGLLVVQVGGSGAASALSLGVRRTRFELPFAR